MAALPGLRGGFTADDLLDPVRMSERTAAEAPFWEPGTQVAYHALTYGWLCDGLVRRVDGRSVGRFFAEEVAAPLGLDLWIGLPEEQEGRVARLSAAADYGITYLGDEPEPLLEAVYGSILLGRRRLERAGLPSRRDPGSERDRRRALDRPPLRLSRARAASSTASGSSRRRPSAAAARSSRAGSARSRAARTPSASASSCRRS